MNYLPLIAFAVIILLFITYAGRARRKQQATQAVMLAGIEVGTEVMTTSGLYGTVVARNVDDTVQLSIAPGVEVKWEIAALRDVKALPEQFRARLEADPDGGAPADTSERTEADRGSIDLTKDDSGSAGDPR